MKAKRNYIIYGLMLAAFAALLLWIVHLGHAYDGLGPGAAPSGEDSPVGLLYDTLTINLKHPLSLLLLQVIAILITVRIFSYLFKYLGQPGVIGEIVAGIVLGPSVLGHLSPETFAFLFDPDSLVPLNIISQIGLVLFMFVIGMELDLGVIRRKASETLVISHASIIVPFLMGMGLAYVVYPEFGARHASFVPFALFVAISVSITAFPVLARIVQERNLSKTPMGMLAIASAANNDVTAWCLLAAVIAVARAGSVTSAFFTIVLTALYILFMFYLVKPFLRKIGEFYNKQETVSKTLVAFIFLVLIISSYITEILGIHALFGAFLAGVVMPANLSFRRVMTEKIEDVALVLFLPLFFVFTGLRTEIGLLNTPHLWGICALFIVVSIAGKMIGATFSARLVGESWKDSLSIGVLMNTRGLMELIVLNIGYEMGIIPSSLFVIFVIMALFTTFMATPLLALIEKIAGYKSRKVRPTRNGHPRILISFANPESGPLFLKLVRLLYGRVLKDAKVTAIHYTIGTETNPLNASDYSKESFSLLEPEAKRLGLPGGYALPRYRPLYRRPLRAGRRRTLRFRADGRRAGFPTQLSRSAASAERPAVEGRQMVVAGTDAGQDPRVVPEYALRFRSLREPRHRLRYRRRRDPARRARPEPAVAGRVDVRPAAGGTEFGQRRLPVPGQRFRRQIRSFYDRRSAGTTGRAAERQAIGIDQLFRLAVHPAQRTGAVACAAFLYHR